MEHGSGKKECALPPLVNGTPLVRNASVAADMFGKV
jgi:hypothetical protein